MVFWVMTLCSVVAAYKYFREFPREDGGRKK
jgi:hypothetical protein